MAVPLAACCALALALVLIPGIGHEIKGSWRWIKIGSMTVQPSEFAKIGMILATAWWISRRRRYMHTLRRGILVPMLGLGLIAGSLAMPLVCFLTAWSSTVASGRVWRSRRILLYVSSDKQLESYGAYLCVS